MYISELADKYPGYYFLDELPGTVIMMVLNLIVTLNNLEFYEKFFHSLRLWETFLNLITRKYTINITDENILFVRTVKNIRYENDRYMYMDLNSYPEHPLGEGETLDFSPMIYRLNQILACRLCMNNHLNYTENTLGIINDMCYKNCEGLHKEDTLRECCSKQKEFSDDMGDLEKRNYGIGKHFKKSFI